MGEYGVFEVYDTPEITSIEGAYNFPYGILVKAGSNITIKGKNFGTDANAIVVMLGEEQIDINGNVTADAISITVPNDFDIPPKFTRYLPFGRLVSCHILPL